MDRWYPDVIMAGNIDDYLSALSNPAFSSPLIRALDQLFHGVERSCLKFAEFGVWKGGTTGQLAKFLNNQGQLHLFDYEDTVLEVGDKLKRAGFSNIVKWGNSYRYLDSYNWSLRLILEHHKDLRFDFIFLDGAHTWAIDALTFLLCERLLNVGGYIDFDDYEWSLRGSSLDPRRVPVTADLYTEAQIDDLQVRAIVDLLVRRCGHYQEIVANRLFQKIAQPLGHQVFATARPIRSPQSSQQVSPSLHLGDPHLFSGELEVMQRVMNSGHRRYLEFGIGGSTLLAIRSNLEKVVAVDSDPSWVDAARNNPEVAAAIESGRANIRYADIGPVGGWGCPDIEHVLSWPTYVATAWDMWSERREVPDLVFVDGRFRVACCLSVFLATAPDADLRRTLELLLHDVCPERSYYAELFQFFDIVESVNTLRVMKIKTGVPSGKAIAMLMRYQFDRR